ncbi:MAG: winged helix-turn-helix transcriptional regulator [Candidatus Thermoplasmatota archaeon]
MTTKTLAPRRLIIALAITLMLGSASVLALGASADQTLGDVPATWGVPEPRIGDKGNYTYALVGEHDGVVVGHEFPYLTFEQLPAVTQLDAAGSPVLANRFGNSFGSYAPVAESMGPDGSMRYAWQIAYGIVLAQATDGTWPYLELDLSSSLGFMTGPSSSTVDVLGMPLTTAQSETNGSYWARLYPHEGKSISDIDEARRELQFCGGRSVLQGQELALDANLALFEPCLLRTGGVNVHTLEIPYNDTDEVGLYEGHFGPETSFRAIGRQVIDGYDAVVFTRVAEDDKETSRRVQVWMAKGVPYPVQWVVEDGHQLHVLRLTQFQRGTEPLAQGLPANRPPAPVVQMAPSQVWGIDDAGTSLAVPASRAWQAALDDGPLATYMEQHPQAFAYWTEGEASEDVVDGRQDFRWAFGVTDGASSFKVLVDAVVEDLVPISPLLGLEIESPKRDPTFKFDYDPGGPAQVPALNRSWLPEQLPSAASLVSRWQAYSGAQEPMAAWGSEVVCAKYVVNPVTEEETCSDHDFRFNVGGRFTSVRTDLSQPGEPRVLSEAALRSGSFREDGRVDILMDLVAAQSTTYGPAAAVAPASQAPYEPPSGSLGDWSMPSIATVAGVGFLAVLAGALYLFWPVVKGGVVGLFSRVTGTELLEHPQRQKLLGCIEAQPGIHLKELARQTGLAWGQTQHHMAKLVSSGAVIAKPSAGYTCYFAKGQDRHVMAAAAVLKADGARRLLATVAATTGLSMGQLSRSVGLTESTAHYHLKRLESAGLVTTHLIDGARRVTLTALGSQAGRVYGGAASAASGAAA